MKSKLRKKFLELRKKHAENSRLKKSLTIKNRLMNLPEFMRARTVMFYISSEYEVNTLDMIKDTIRQKNIAVPVTNLERKDMSVSLLEDLKHLDKGVFNILEPKKELVKLIDPRKLDTVIVPGIVFDLKGNRIGYGLGFYDRFLCGLGRVLKIGLAFDFQVIPHIEKEEHDVRVDMIVTEKRTIDCRRCYNVGEFKIK